MSATVAIAAIKMSCASEVRAQTGCTLGRALDLVIAVWPTNEQVPGTSNGILQVCGEVVAKALERHQRTEIAGLQR